MKFIATKHFHGLWKLCFLMLISILSVDAIALETDKVEKIRQHIVDALSHQTTLGPLRVGFKMYSYDSDGEKQKLSSWCSGTLVSSWNSFSPVRVDYTENVIEWNDETSPYHNDVQTIAYNGQYWVNAIKRRGALGKESNSRSVVISSECPSDFTFPRWNTPEFLFANLATIFNERTIRSCLMKELQKFNVKFSIAPNGNFLLYLYDNDANPSVTGVAEFDKDQNFSLKRVEIKMNQRMNLKNQVSILVEVLEFIKIKGIVIPKKGKRTVTTGGKISAISECELFEPKIHEVSELGLFDVNFTPGWRVFDKRFGTRFTIGKPIKDIQDDIKCHIKDAVE
jgi:hypothetical protein